jgi:hypothetical protein
MGAIVDRAVEIVGHRDGLMTKPAVWHNPTKTCKVIEFCSVPHPGDEVGYAGRAKDLLIFDEAANFLERQVRFLMTWLRTADPAQRCQCLLTFNPPTTSDGRWIIRYFAPWIDHKHPNPAKSGELRWFAQFDDREVEVPGPAPIEHKGKLIRPMSRTFIAARVDDNPDLAESTHYKAVLDGLPDGLRQLMRDGDFRASMEDDPMQVIPTAWIEAAMARWTPRNPMPGMDSLGVDVAMGGRDQTVIARRHGLWFDEPIAYDGTQCPDGPTIAGYILAAQRNRAPIHIDLFGVGAEPYGHLMSMQAPVLGVSMAEKSHEMALEGRRPLFNVRTKIWWRMREALDPTNPHQIALPDDRRLLADLCAPKWEERAGGIIQVEGRDEIIETLGRSPDYGTAYCLALMHSPALIGRGEGWEQRDKPYDPLGTAAATGRSAATSYLSV